MTLGHDGITDAHRARQKSRSASRQENNIFRRAGSDPAPLSFAQERFLLADALGPGAHRNGGMLLYLTGELDLAALDAAITEVVRRHEILRTAVSPDPARTGQVVRAPGPRSARVVPLPGASMDLRDPLLGAAVQADLENPLDIGNAEVLRATLYQLAPRQHALTAVIHYMAGDPWSPDVLARELAALYSSYARHQAPALPELPLQYADYAAWQRSAGQESSMAAAAAYWAKALDGAPPLLELPIRGSRPATARFASAVEEFTLDAETTRALRAWGRGNGFSTRVSFAAALSAQLRLYSGSEDIVLAMPFAQREPRAVEQLIGCFMNTTVLRADLRGDPSFHELAGRLRAAWADAREHACLPFERLVQAVSPERARSHHPVAQVSLAVHGPPEASLDMPGVRARLARLDGGRGGMDLAVRVTRLADGTRGELEYDPGLFDAAVIRGLAAGMARAIRAVTADPGVTVSALTALDEETSGRLRSWNETRAEFAAAHLMHRLVEEQARRNPDAVAVISGAASMTYGELDASASRLARYLRELGVVPEARVGVCLERSAAEVTAILAILKAGGVYVPVNPRDPQARRDELIDLAKPLAVLSAADLADEIWSPGRRVIDLDDVAGDIAALSPAPLDVPVDPQNLAYILFTSGTTGRSKGVMVTHRGFCNRMLWGQANHRLTTADRVLRKAVCTFDVSLDELFRALFSGAASVQLPEGAFDPRRIADVIEQAGVTDADFSPTALRELIRAGEAGRCASLTRIVSGVEELKPDLARAIHENFRVRLFNLYGPTEVSVSCTARPCPPGEDREPVPIGRPIANMRTYILDERMRQVPPGVTGSLFVAGPGLARGYLDRPDLTAAAFVPDPFAAQPGERMYRTGDLARFTADGEIEFRGRADSQLSFRGYRIEAREVEARLCELPGVAAAVVTVRTDASGVTRLVAYVTGPPGAAGPASELRGALRRQLPGHMVPGIVVRVAGLPQTQQGKLDYGALPDPFTAGEAAGPAAGEQPRNHAEALLARIWQDALNVARVGIHDDFFELGGDSITAMRIISRARKELGRDVEVGAIFDCPTIAELAAVLAAGSAAREEAG